MKKEGLSKFTTEELAEELLVRADFFDGAMLKFMLYRLSIELGIIPCVDGVAVRKRGDIIEALAIRRNTGPFKGKLCSIGGRILFEESFEQAMRRHAMSDLGTAIEFITPWDKPAAVHQFMRPRTDGSVLPDFGCEPTRRHNMTLIYLIRLKNEHFTFGSTPHGGQEAAAAEWFSLDAMPPPGEFGYGQEVYFKKCLEIAQTLL
jgi:ADP-ribose pyrophosphatase YjhB (NUDIX family)